MIAPDNIQKPSTNLLFLSRSIHALCYHIIVGNQRRLISEKIGMQGLAPAAEREPVGKLFGLGGDSKHHQSVTTGRCSLASLKKSPPSNSHPIALDSDGSGFSGLCGLESAGNLNHPAICTREQSPSTSFVFFGLFFSSGARWVHSSGAFPLADGRTQERYA